jgi:hypothetical protein
MKGASRNASITALTTFLLLSLSPLRWLACPILLLPSSLLKCCTRHRFLVMSCAVGWIPSIQNFSKPPKSQLPRPGSWWLLVFVSFGTLSGNFEAPADPAASKMDSSSS